jgi:hypothetical protein
MGADATTDWPDARIIFYAMERISDPVGATRVTSWRKFHRARNAIVRACRRHGPTGPMGEFPLRTWKGRNPYRCPTWQCGDRNPAYYVLPDQFNSERYIYIELLSPVAVTVPWMRDVSRTLTGLKHWGLCVAGLPGGYAVIFPGVIAITGKPFKGVSSVRAFLSVLRREVQTRQRQGGKRLLG